jgi:hypothetical protein
MGCQCAKSEETGQMNLDKSPPKNISEEEQQAQLSVVQSKAKLESADLSKISHSQINDSNKVVKKKKKTKKAGKFYK